AIETVLINLVRGTGISGLHGILPLTGVFIRPILFLTAEEISTVTEQLELAYVEDSSNLSSNYTRNKIRLQVIPQLREINPSLEQTFKENIARFTETEQVLQQVVDSIRKNICTENKGSFSISIPGLLLVSPIKLLTFELLRPYDFSAKVVQEIIDSLTKQTGTSFYSPTHRATIDRDTILVTAISELTDSITLWHSNEHIVVHRESMVVMTVTGQLPWQFDPEMAYIDHEKLIFPLIVRNWQQGDTFIPLGMTHQKKLSDLFIDNKVPLPMKETIPILINGNSEIIWVGGIRQDERYKVAASTKKVAIFELKNQHGE
ncbi:MAG: tRNA(Ile)-lysidine synthetase, partial [Pedobacter sp.]